jgi:kinesin family protein 5
MNEREKSISMVSIADFPDNRTVLVNSSDSPGVPVRFTYDYVFKPGSAQALVYEQAAKNIVESVMQGFNGTVFAYGQTSSGKTFTMTGPDIDDFEMQGIIPRMVHTVFEDISSTDSHIEFTVKVSYCEIYLEKIKDLFQPDNNNLKIHEDKTRGIFIADLAEEYVSSEEEVYALMKLGTSNREVGSTNMNEGSSRSHAIFMITVTQTNSVDLSSKTGKLYLVDLAGSEKVSKTGAEGKRLDEAKNINKSLSTLGMVIYALTDGKSTHVPYRDSKLTRVLQDSLGGNSKTALIITCSPSPYNEAETISTLRFGIRAKSIKNKPKINREYTIPELKLLLSKAQEELKLKERRINILERTIKLGGISIPTDPDSIPLQAPSEELNLELKQELEDVKALLSNTQEKLAIMEKELYDKEEIQQGMECIILEYDSKFKEMQEEIERSHAKIVNLDEEVEKLSMVKETLQMDISTLRQQKLNIDQLVTEKVYEIEQLKLAEKLKGEKSQTDRLNERLKDANQNLTYALEVNEKLKKDIQELNAKLNASYSGGNYNVDSLKDNIRREILSTEKAKWDHERELIFRDLKNRVDKVIDLEMKLDEVKERYFKLQNTLSYREKGLDKRVEVLERNLHDISNAYQHLSFEKAEAITEKNIYVAKFNSVNDQLSTLTKKLKVVQEEAKMFKSNLDLATQELNNFRHSSKYSVAPLTGRVKKTIRGGYSFLASGNSSFLAPSPHANTSVFLFPDEYHGSMTERSYI